MFYIFFEAFGRDVQRDEGLVAPHHAALRVDAAEELAQSLHALKVGVVAAQLERGERAVAFQLVAQGRDQARSSVVGHVETREGGRHLGDALDAFAQVSAKIAARNIEGGERAGAEHGSDWSTSYLRTASIRLFLHVQVLDIGGAHRRQDARDLLWHDVPHDESLRSACAQLNAAGDIVTVDLQPAEIDACVQAGQAVADCEREPCRDAAAAER